jgi:hypothetical protein
MEYNENPDGLTADVVVVVSQPPPPAIASLVTEEFTQEVELGLPSTRRLILQSAGVSGRPSSIVINDDELDCILTQSYTNYYRCRGSNGVDWEVGPSDGLDGAQVIASATPEIMAGAGYDSGTAVIIDGVEFEFERDEFEFRVPTDFSPGDGEAVDVSVEEHDDMDDDETKQAKNRRVEFILLRGVVIDDVFTAESTEGISELVAVSNSGDSGPPPEMLAFANGVELEQLEDRLQRVFDASVEDFGTTEFEAAIGFYDGERQVDNVRVPVVLGAEWTTAITARGATVGVRFDRADDRGDQLRVTLDGDSTATTFEAELIGDESSVFAFGSFVTQWRTKVWADADTRCARRLTEMRRLKPTPARKRRSTRTRARS